MEQKHVNTNIPKALLENTTLGFTLGTLASTPYQLLTSPTGSRLCHLAKAAPKSGATLAFWAANYAILGSVDQVRGLEEKPFTNLMACAATAGLCSATRGVRAGMTQFVVVGAALAVIHGLRDLQWPKWRMSSGL